VLFSDPGHSSGCASGLNRPCDYAVTGEALGSRHPADLEERSFNIAMTASCTVLLEREAFRVHLCLDADACLEVF
jgi:hypothetical protein